MIKFKIIFVVVILFSMNFFFSCTNLLDKYEEYNNDNDAPRAELLNAPPDFTNSTEINITVSGTDVVSYRYNFDNAGWSGDTDIAVPIIAAGLAQGSHMLEVIGSDIAGTWQDEDNATECNWTVDTVGPVGTFFINNGDQFIYSYSAGLTMDFADAVEMRFSNDGASWSEWETYISAKDWEIDTDVSMPAVSAEFRDKAGNISQFDDDIRYINKILASDGTGGDSLSCSVGISQDGNSVILGAYGDNNGTGSGSAYLYNWDGLDWNEIKIIASDSALDDYFGMSVAISSDASAAITGTPGSYSNVGYTDPGSAYIYNLNVSPFTETLLTASDGSARDGFGISTDISSDGYTVIVGAVRDDNSAGSAYIYKWNGASWIQTKLTASDRAASDVFGYSVSISGDGNTAIAGAYGDDDNGDTSGSAYIFRWNGSSWAQSKITASDGKEWDFFGYSVAVSSNGNIACVGSPFFPNGASYTIDYGAVYIYRWNGSSWVQSKITATDGEDDDKFGVSVDISSDGNILIAGARGDDDNGSGSGSAYIYTWNGSAWIQTKLLAADGAADDWFGKSVSVSADGETVIVGAYRDDNNEIDTGSAYIFRWNGSEWIDY